MSNNLFSHSPDPDYVAIVETERRLESVVLGVPVEHAFDGFTDGAHLWWPVDTESTFGEGSHVAFLRDHLVEESLDGDELIWADVADWASPSLIKLEWTLGVDPQSTLDVEIRFDEVSAETCRVSIEFDHSEAPVDDGRGGFHCDWSLIVSRYARFMGGAVGLD
jgi:hypothetical protein